MKTIIAIDANFKNRNRSSIDKIKEIDKYLEGFDGLVHDTTILSYNSDINYSAYFRNNNNASYNDIECMVSEIRSFMNRMKINHDIRSFNSFMDKPFNEANYPVTFKIFGDHIPIKKIEEFISGAKMKLSDIEEIVNIYDSINYLKAEFRGSTLTNFCLAFNIDHGTNKSRCGEIKHEIRSIIESCDIDLKVLIS